MSEHADFWDRLLAETVSRPPAAEVDPLPIRSTDFADGYAVKLTSLGDYRLFAYYSVPHGQGPFPAVYHAPGYASVVQVPPYEERRSNASLSLAGRGQRLSDKPYAAAFPGFLTDGIEDPERCPFRGFVADALRGVDFLKSRQEVDRAQIVAVGGDTSFFVAALRPEIRGAVIADPFLLRLRDVAPTTTAYPQEEVNDYLRARPDSREAVHRTLDLFDPWHLAERVRCRVLLSQAPGATWADELAARVGPNAEVYRRTGRGYLDRVFVEEWISSLRS